MTIIFNDDGSVTIPKDSWNELLSVLKNGGIEIVLSATTENKPK
jgi:hypothetical protein